MAIVRALVEIPCDSALPEDAAMNTFHFSTLDPLTPAMLDAMTSHLDDFYNLDAGTTLTCVGDYIANTMNGAAATVSYYNLTDPPPRAPVRQDPLPIAVSATTTSLPRESAVCLSYQGPQVSGLPQARRRGRLYIGPLSGFNVDLSAFDLRPNTTMRDAFAAAAERLANDSTATTTPWGVYSVVNDDITPITNGWIDNALDSQRRRGRAATLRTLWAV